MATRVKYLRRYTELSALFYLLSRRKLTLLDPQRWDDKNDSYCLRQYRRKKGLQSVLALCFVETSERYHLWKVYGAGANGVRIKFYKEALLDAVKKVPGTGMLHRSVEYLLLGDIKGSPDVDRLPFMKRWGFQDEKEYRLVYGSDDDLPQFDISIPLSCIHSIRLNPWLHPNLFDPIEDALHKIDHECRSLEIVRSSLINNEAWRAFAKRAVASKKAGANRDATN